MTNLNPNNFKIQRRDRLFYDRWRYSAQFTLPRASLLRNGIERQQISNSIKRRAEWVKSLSTSLYPYYYASSKLRFKPITPAEKQKLYRFSDVLCAYQGQFKLSVSVSYGTIFTSSLELIEKIHSDSPADVTCVNQAEISLPRDTIELKNSKYKLRSYLRSMNLSGVDKEYLSNFFKNNSEEIRISPGLTDFINSDSAYCRTWDYYFIDYNNQQWALMLNLVCPNIIRKTQTIVSKSAK